MTYNVQTNILEVLSKSQNAKENVQEWYELCNKSEKKINLDELAILMKNNININDHAQNIVDSPDLNFHHSYIVIRYSNQYHDFGKTELEQNLFEELKE